MATDEDMFVVIIEEENKEAESNSNPETKGVSDIQIKDEGLDRDIPVENILEQASKHGYQIDIDFTSVQDVKDEPIEYLEEDFDDYDSQSDNNFDDKSPYLNTEDDNIKADDLFSVQNDRHRYSMLAPSEQKSFVDELRNEYPDLNENEDLLVNCLYEIMKTVKPPPPPQDYYVMNDVMLECIICGTMSETIPAAGRHYQEKHGPRYLICFSCGVDFRSTTNLYKHEKRCVNPDAGIVLKARALYLSRRCREKPVRKKTNRPQSGDNRVKEKFHCMHCPAVFLAKLHLISHLNLHEGKRPFKCETCGAAYTSQAALKRHEKKHSDVKFICGTCGHVFKAKPALISHMDTHRPEKKFGCVECSKRYATRFALKLHVDRVHRRLPPPCPCQICPKRYARMSLLKEHMRKEHEMLLITRKMFFKSLPTLSKTQIDQAKVVFKSEVEEINKSEPLLLKKEESNEEEEPLSEEANEEQYAIQLNDLPEQLVHYLNNTPNANELKIMAIPNGDDTNMVLDFNSICVVGEIDAKDVE